MTLTSAGSELAEAVANAQEAAVGRLWAEATQELETIAEIGAPLLTSALGRGLAANPAAFPYFAAVCDRPTLAGCVLRIITAMRFWRADAHRAASRAAGLSPAEAHALNRLWDSHRRITRVGQGFTDPGKKGVRALEARGWADNGAISTSGVEHREQLETDTDMRTASLYTSLADIDRSRLLAALTALPG